MNMATAKCERTDNSIPLSDGFFVADVTSGEWSFVSKGAPENHSDYNVPVVDLCKSPEALVDWIAQLSEKPWFSPNKFIDFFTRFRQANNLFGYL